MNEVEINQKLDVVVKLAQSRILTFLGDFTNADIIAKVNEVFNKYPICIEGIEKEVNVFGETRKVGGVATPDNIVISKEDIVSVSLDEEYEVDKLLGTIIHEYAHQFRKINSQYGEMFEEAYATIFAETCINYSKIKNFEKTPNNEMFHALTSVEYRRAESQVRGLMFALRNKKMDIRLMLEYILGNEKYFQQACSQIFGQGFNEYYNEVINLQENRQHSNKSEQLLVELLTNYIKENDISVKKCYQNSELELSHLYSINSPVFIESVVNAGQSSLRPEEQELFSTFEYSAKINREEKQFIVDEKIARIQNMISQKYGLSGKAPEQIHEVLMDICSDYIQFKNRTDEEGMIYLDEIRKIIPNIEEFSSTFKQLRISGLDKKIIENLDLNNVSYSSLFATMDSLIPKPKVEVQSSPQQTSSIMPEQKQQTTQISQEYTQNNSVAEFQQARMSEIEKRSVERNQQLSYAIAKKMNQAELEQYAQNMGGHKK